MSAARPLRSVYAASPPLSARAWALRTLRKRSCCHAFQASGVVQSQHSTRRTIRIGVLEGDARYCVLVAADGRITSLGDAKVRSEGARATTDCGLAVCQSRKRPFTRVATR